LSVTTERPGSSLGPASRFRALALVAPRLDARPGLRLLRARRTMEDAELAEMLRVLAALPAAVDAWSEGNAALEMERVEVLDEPIRSLTRVDATRWWVAPSDVRAALGRFAAGRAFDSIFLVYPTDGSFPLCGWGCSAGPSEASAGAGWSSIISDHWQEGARNPHPEQGFVHEWLHQVEAMYRGSGVLGAEAFPDLHDVDGRTSTRLDEPPFGRPYVDWERETGSWQPWYRDLMTGTVSPKGIERSPVGMTRDRWALRGRRAR
jgi:hypothetical protein